MINLVIALEQGNLNPVLDSFGYQTRNYFLTKETSERAIARIFQEISVEKRRRPADIMISATRHSMMKTFRVSEIYYIESFGNIKCINGKGGIFEFYGTLKKIELLMERFGFMRVSKSFIISLHNLDEIGTRTVRMRDGKEINIGRKYIPDFRTAIKNMNMVRLNHNRIIDKTLT